MAVGKASDFKIYDEYFDAGYTEVMQQEADAFNAASGGAITLGTTDAQGEYAYGSFFQEVSNMVQRRDATSTSALTATALTQGEQVAVNVRYRTPYMVQTIDSFRRKRLDPMLHSRVLGEQFARALQLYWLNTSLSAAVAAIKGYNSEQLVFDATDGALAYSDLNSGLFLFGDAQNRIRALVMRSQHQKNLVGDSLANYKFDNGAGLAIADASVGTMNRLAVVTDSASLVETDGVSSGNDSVHLLGLVPGAIMIEEADQPIVHTEVSAGSENLTIEFQAEGSFNLSLKGFSWDVANGGANPTASAIATSTNWDANASDYRNTLGVAIETADA